MKQHILKKIPLFVTVSVLLACIVFSGCAGRTVITDAQFKSACEAADCEVTDVSDQFDSSVITKALTVSVKIVVIANVVQRTDHHVVVAPRKRIVCCV